MGADETAVVTGAFGFTSGRIAQRLLANRQNVRTLTGHPDPSAPLADDMGTEYARFLRR